MSITTDLSWSYVGAALCVSSFGCAAALHMSRHRTGQYGAQNILTVVAISVALTAVGMFSALIVNLTALTLTYYPPELNPQPTQVDFTYDPTLIALSIAVPTVFTIFGVFFSAHPDADNKYVWKKYMGLAFIAASSTGQQWLTLLGIIQSSSNIGFNVANVVAAVIIGFVASILILYVFFYRQYKQRNGVIEVIITALLMGVTQTATHTFGIISIILTPTNVQGTDGSISADTLLIVVFSLIAMVFMMLAINLWRFRYVIGIEPSSSDSLILSVFVNDDRGRILLTQSGSLPSIKICPASLHQLSVNDPRFINMFISTYNWQLAFRRLDDVEESEYLLQNNNNNNDNNNNNSIPPQPQSLLIFAQFLNAAVQLSYRIRLPLHSLGIMYMKPLNDMVTLCTRCQHPSRLSEGGVYRWVEADLAKAFLTRHYGRSAHDTEIWINRLTLYHNQCLSDVNEPSREQIAPSQPPSQSVDVALRIPESNSTATANSQSTRSAPSALPPSNPEQSLTIAPLHERSDTNATQTSSNNTATSPRAAALVAGANINSIGAIKRTPTFRSPKLVSSDQCQLYVGLHHVNVDVRSNGTNILLATKQSYYHLPPLVRIRMNNGNSGSPKTSLNEYEYRWLQSCMEDEEIRELDLAERLNDLMTDCVAFKCALWIAVRDLATMIGSSHELKLSNLHSLTPIVVAPNVYLLCFTAATTDSLNRRVSAATNFRASCGYSADIMTAIPYEMFECINCNKWSIDAKPVEWVSDLLRSSLDRIEDGVQGGAIRDDVQGVSENTFIIQRDSAESDAPINSASSLDAVHTHGMTTSLQQQVISSAATNSAVAAWDRSNIEKLSFSQTESAAPASTTTATAAGTVEVEQPRTARALLAAHLAASIEPKSARLAPTITRSLTNYDNVMMSSVSLPPISKSQLERSFDSSGAVPMLSSSQHMLPKEPLSPAVAAALVKNADPNGPVSPRRPLMRTITSDYTTRAKEVGTPRKIILNRLNQKEITT